MLQITFILTYLYYICFIILVEGNIHTEDMLTNTTCDYLFDFIFEKIYQILFKMKNIIPNVPTAIIENNCHCSITLGHCKELVSVTSKCTILLTVFTGQIICENLDST